MLSRLELYVDAALLSLPCGVLLLLAASAMRIMGGSEMALPVFVIGAVVAIWLARILHRTTTREPLTREQARTISIASAGLTIAAALLAVQTVMVGAEWPIVWIVVSILVAALAVALVADSLRDLMRERSHKTLDALRIVLIGFLGFSWVSSGFNGGIGVWVAGVAAYMVGVAVIAAVCDLIVSWRMHGTESHTGGLAVGA